MKTVLTLTLFCSIVFLTSCSKEDDNQQTAAPTANSSLRDGNITDTDADAQALRLIIRSCNNAGCHGTARASGIQTLPIVRSMIKDGSFNRRLFVTNAPTACGSINKGSMDMLKAWYDSQVTTE